VPLVVVGATAKVAITGLKVGSIVQLSIELWCYGYTMGAFDLRIHLCGQDNVPKQSRILFKLTDAFTFVNGKYVCRKKE
jgi:hypothetical protein